MTVHSRYRIIPLLLILLLNIGWGWICALLLYLAISREDFFETIPPQAMIFMIMIFLVEIMILNILLKDCRRIKIDDKKIVFINPIFPFIRKSYQWRKLDYHLTVIVYAKYGGAYENIWLIRKRRVKARIPSFYFTNYMEIKDSLKLPDQGERQLKGLKKITCHYGWSKVPTFYSRYRS